MARRFEGLNSTQQELFERIAIGDDTGVNPRTVKTLIQRGLVEQYEQRDGIYIWHHYRVPVAVHLRWCAWCVGEEA